MKLYCENCKAPSPFRTEHCFKTGGDIVCNECHWIITSFFNEEESTSPLTEPDAIFGMGA